MKINFTNYEHFMVDFHTQEFINHFTCTDRSKFYVESWKGKKGESILIWNCLSFVITRLNTTHRNKDRR